MTTIDIIRKEVDRLVEEARNNPGLRWDAPEYILGVQAILPFLDTLQEQEPQGLDEAANEFANQDCVTFISRKKGFIAGAEWMANKMK